mmetsp:Transcript_19658/g.36926  ORF Transcript_19658/g.36926 Transcript_19658/m.36926 type:complete len:219 (+) Transcript_19658:148-804(+)
MSQNRVLRQLRQPAVLQTLCCAWSTQRVNAQHAQEQVHGLALKQRLAPMTEQVLQSRIPVPVDVCKELVSELGSDPGSVSIAHAKKAHSTSEHIPRRSCIAPGFRLTNFTCYRVGRQANLIQSRSSFMHDDITSSGIGRYDDPSVTMPRHKAFWGSICVFSNRQEIAQLLTSNRVTLHGVPKVHQPDAAVLQQQVLQADVTVTYVMGMQILHGLKRLP